MSKFGENFTKNRINLLLLLPYLPIGFFLLVSRLFIFSFQYFLFTNCIQIILPTSVAKFIRNVMQVVLGQVVCVHNKTKLKPNHLLISNKVSHLDSMALSLSCKFRVAGTSRWGDVEKRLFSLSKLSDNSDKREKELRSLMEKHQHVVVHPEYCPTNRKVLLPFCDWPFRSDYEIQPILMDISRLGFSEVNVFESKWYGDLFWALFCPFTIYDVTVLDPMPRQDGESVSDFKSRIQQKMSKELRVAVFDDEQVNEDDIQSVASLLPFICSRGVIIKELVKTSSIDEAVNNLSKKAGVKNKKQKVQRANKFSQDPSQRQMTLEEKKAAFVRNARNAYIKKHNLCLT